MDIQLRILTGARAGARFPYSQRVITVGRHHDSDLQFDPEGDLVVSGRHAVLTHVDGNWLIADQGSTNGTFVNERRISSETRLNDGDLITFGGQGPTVEFRCRSASPASPLSSPALTAAAVSDPTTVERLRIELSKRGKTLRYLSALSLLAVLLVAGAFILYGRRDRASWARERTAMRVQMDSIQLQEARTVEALEQQVLDLAGALGESQKQIQVLEVALIRARQQGATSEVENLQKQLQTRNATLQRQQLAAKLDFRSIQARNRPAIAMIYVEYANGEVATATAFAVRANATLLTNRHVVLGEDGRGNPRRMAIQFSDSEQVWPARLLAVSKEVDLAAVKVDNIVGSVPTVQSFNTRADSLPPGTPVALIGFPLGGETQSAGGKSIRPRLSAGTLGSASGNRVEVQGYGAVGASGSPIFDSNGYLIAVLFGGRRDADSQTLYAVPASAIAPLLDSIPR